MAGFVPYTERETYQLHRIPKPHMRNIGRRAVQKKMSYADVVAKVLTDRCGIPFVPSQRHRYGRAWTNDSLSIRLPTEVMNCVRQAADHDKITFRSVILNFLSDEFKLKRPPVTHVPGKRPGRRKET